MLGTVPLLCNNLRSPLISIKILRSLQSTSFKLDHKEERTNPTLEKIRKELEEDKVKLRWRKTDPDEWNSKFQAFNNEEQTSDYIVAVQQPIDLSPKAIKRWWKKRQETRERFMQQFIPERHEILGPDLATAHFILHRGGAARFLHDNVWRRANENREFVLPNKYNSSYKLEALRCDNMILYYEGLENIRGLQSLKFLSFHNVKTFDDFCLDRISGSQLPNLEVLDISGTSCTENGLSCLYRLPTLKLLIVDDPKKTLRYKLYCAMLEETILQLKIVPATSVHDNKIAE